MPSALTLVAVVLLYVGMLVLVGWRAERSGRALPPRLRPVMYSLSLATLCSAWTYFGSVGDAAEGSWLFAANALGPVLAVTLGYPMWRKLATLSKQENVGSLADFLAARYGKSRVLGILCAVTAALGALPYIALQLSLLTTAWAFATSRSAATDTSGLLLIGILVVVAIIFGARSPSLTQQNRGFIAILAVEACVKIAGLLCVAALALWLIGAQPGGAARALAAVPPLPPSSIGSFVTLTFLCTVTAFTLPRQFHLGFVAIENPDDTRTARWLVPAYFGLWAVATLAIAVALRSGFAVPGVPPALQVIGLPIRYGGDLLALVPVIGGLSAGAAMVAVETTATSAMISNEIVLPLLARLSHRRLAGSDVSRSILLVRRATLMLMGALGWFYYLAVRDIETPTALGQTALTAFAQFLPALLGAIYWRRGHVDGAIAGIASGMLLWFATVAGPALMSSPAEAQGGAASLWPQVDDWAIQLSIVLSLSVNALVYVVISLLAKPRLIDTIQARSFVGDEAVATARDEHAIRAQLGDVRDLLARFMGEDAAEKALLDLKASMRGDHLADDTPITPTHARLVEKMLAGVIGAPSARNVVSIAISSQHQSTSEVGRILDEAAHAVHFSRDLLQTALESLSEGVAVVDGDMRVVAWNGPYLQMLGVGLTHVYVGKPLSELFDRDPGAADALAARASLARWNARIAERNATREEWQLPGERVILATGKPLLQGDYLITLADITELRAAEQVLAQDKEVLERRVADRTRELAEANRVALHASSAQKRFVATASHDLVQPLHAARLFIGNVLPALEEQAELRDMLHRADQAVNTAHELMRALLNLSRLETDAVQPQLQPVDANLLLRSLADEFGPQARGRGVELIVRPTRFWVRSDGDLLRSMLQNLVSNALRYTPNGRVLVAARPESGRVRFEVRDTGVGIGPDRIPDAFAEYGRLAEGRSLADGAGLGLAIVQRIGQVLDHPITVRSRLGEGSVFAFSVPVASAMQRQPAVASAPASLAGLRVLCVDDERDILIGTKALIERWGGSVDAVASAELVDPHATWDVVIADNLLPGESGLALLRRLKGRCPRRVLLTATAEEAWDAELPADGIALLRKPVDPLALRALLAEAAAQADAMERVTANS